MIFQLTLLAVMIFSLVGVACSSEATTRLLEIIEALSHLISSI